LFVDASIVCPPIAIVRIDSSCAVNRIHATHFWETALSTLADFIDCGNGSDFRMGASTLVFESSLLYKFGIKVGFSMWKRGK
jgi:hypothetical protein